MEDSLPFDCHHNIFISFYNSSFSQFIYYEKVPIGDTIGVGWVRDIPSGNFCHDVNNVSYTHQQGADFFPTIIQGQGGIEFDASIFFAPKKIGTQNDSFIFNIEYTGRDCPLPTNTHPVVTLRASGISDSISLVRFKGWNNPDYRMWYYSWNTDSNRYLNSQSPLGPVIELINNVEDSTRFEFTIDIDTSAHIHSWIVIGKDSSELPHTFKCKPEVRRLYSSIYFYSDSKGFYKDTSFSAGLKVVISNSTKSDTLGQGNRLFFGPIPTKSVNVPFKSGMNNFSIFSTPDNSIAIIYSNLSQSENTTIELYDALGRLLPLSISQLQIPSGKSSQKLEIGNLSSGCYILRMKMKDQVISKSFIVTR